ncbi:hypothetical protein ACQEVF_59725 [Nonomuraea polychroma]|uniref:hypothetical protein n=1 Tax=Nonomuraea polychroma TaxID=46176 RepID=UPI003D94832A
MTGAEQEPHAEFHARLAETLRVMADELAKAYRPAFEQLGRDLGALLEGVRHRPRPGVRCALRPLDHVPGPVNCPACREALAAIGRGHR